MHAAAEARQGVGSMRRFKIAILAVLASALVAPAPARAASEAGIEQALRLETTRDLYTICSVQPGQPLYERAVAFCLGFTTGVMQYHEAVAEGPTMRPLVCPGRELARFEVVKQFLDWAPAHPDLMSAPPVEGLARSATAKWPCPRS